MYWLNVINSPYIKLLSFYWISDFKVLQDLTDNKFLFGIDSRGTFAIRIQKGFEKFKFKCSDFGVTFKTMDYENKRKFQIETFKVSPGTECRLSLNDEDEIRIIGRFIF